MNGPRRPWLAGRRRDALWLFGSQLVAIVVTFVATPIELDRMGSERYGIVVVLSAAVGYVGLLDIGAAWAVMRFVPWHQAREDDEAAQRVVAAAMLLSLTVGVTVGSVVFFLAEPLSSVLDLSAGSERETAQAVRVTAASVPVLLLVSLFSGLGRAVGMFPLVGVVSAGQVVVLNCVWVAVAGTSHDVIKVVVAQLVIGCLAIGVSAVALRIWRGWRLPRRLPGRETLREIAGFGGKTSSGQAGMGLLMAADKPVLGSVISVSAVPLYSIPFALAMRITLVSSSIASALFPPAVAALSQGNESEFVRLRGRALGMVGLVSGLLAVNCVFGGRPLLSWWLDPGFAEDGWPALAILGVGFAVLACGSIATVLLDAAGRPGAAALLMLAGGATGLTLAAGLGAVLDSPSAASVGITVGLLIIGLGGVEMVRRLARPEPRLRTLALVFGAWVPLAIVGAALRVASEWIGLPALASVLAIAAGTTAAAFVAYRRLEAANTTTAPDRGPAETVADR